MNVPSIHSIQILNETQRMGLGKTASIKAHIKREINKKLQELQERAKLNQFRPSKKMNIKTPRTNPNQSPNPNTNNFHHRPRPRPNQQAQIQTTSYLDQLMSGQMDTPTPKTNYNDHQQSKFNYSRARTGSRFNNTYSNSYSTEA